MRHILRDVNRLAANAALLTVAALLATPEPAIVRHYTPRDQEIERYAYVPVDVPAGVTAITITYAYDAQNGANAIDLGLFEPGSLDLGSKAFRGWSGGARNRIKIGVAEATPGYWPGPIPPGQWHVVLGLYKVAPGGVDVTTTVEFSRDAANARALPSRSAVPLRRGPGWFTGVLHAHTTESDGGLTVPQLIEKAEREKLDFLAITDHNNTTHQLFPLDRPDLLVISGEEVTTPAGHFNVWGLGSERDEMDFRISAGAPWLSTTLAKARGRGNVIGINHPVSDCVACSWTQSIPADVDAIEIANGTDGERAQSMIIWDTLLRAGRRVTAVEGRDWHRGVEPLGAPVIRVWAADLSTASILDAIRQGRAIVMASATLPAVDLTIRSGNRTAAIGDTLTLARGEAMVVDVVARGMETGARVDWAWNGEVLASAPLPRDGRVTFERAAANGYARIHIVGATGRLLAVTNPIFIAVR